MQFINDSDKLCMFTDEDIPWTCTEPCMDRCYTHDWSSKAGDQILNVMSVLMLERLFVFRSGF